MLAIQKGNHNFGTTSHCRVPLRLRASQVRATPPLLPGLCSSWTGSCDLPVPWVPVFCPCAFLPQVWCATMHCASILCVLCADITSLLVPCCCLAAVAISVHPQQRVTPDVQTGCISCASGDGKFGGPIWWNTPMDDADAEAEGAEANRSTWGAPGGGGGGGGGGGQQQQGGSRKRPGEDLEDEDELPDEVRARLEALKRAG